MNNVSNGRTLADVVATMKEDAKEFVQTRVQLLKIELQQKAGALRVAALLAAVAIVLLGTAYLLLTLALAALVAAALADNPYHWVFGFLTIAVLWLLAGGMAAYFAKREFDIRGVLPRRTIEVLKADKLWLQNEARNQL
ncbi:MAG: phage holin family protein [Candidatus Sulfotelmatobacter sp.]